MKTFFRILLAALFSPLWLPAYLLLVLCSAIAAVLFNLVLFVGKGECDKELWSAPLQVATLKMFRSQAKNQKGEGQ